MSFLIFVFVDAENLQGFQRKTPVEQTDRAKRRKLIELLGAILISTE